MKVIITLGLMFLSLISFSQKRYSIKLGEISKEELSSTVYEKDSTANTVVLYEKGNVYLDEDNDYEFRTDYYKKIKFFNKKEIEKATIKINLYKNQKVKHIKAITYNLNKEIINKSHLLDSQIFEKQLSENWKEITFTLPNIKEGCVVEYVYSFFNPYSNLKDWNFQSDIPKLKSEYRASILGNWRYNARIIGFKKLDRDTLYVEEECVQIPGYRKNGDCIVTEYTMDNVPAFKEEDYMLSKKNFMSRLVFELASYTSTDGTVRKYTKSWKSADRTINQLFLDKQTSKKNYFKDILPEELFAMKSPLKKAKSVYYHIQERMNWNNNYWTSKKLKIKKAYEERKGSVDAINLSLYNSLQALDIESYIVMLSTRENGLPTKLFPVVDDFNYVIVKAIIDGETFFLDATNKLLPFGEVPKRCLNGEGRVLDIKKGGYWEVIKPRFKTYVRTQAKLAFNEEKELVGELTVGKQGYFALNEKAKVKSKVKEDFLDAFETEYPNIEVNDVVFDGLNDNEKPLKGVYDINVDFNEKGNELEINPFLYVQNVENPFKLKERNYPVDFGSPYTEASIVNVKIPEGYIIKSLPENKNFSLPAKGGRYLLKVNKTNESINIYTKLSIERQIYSNEEYYYLKEFYNQIIKSQESLIVLKKK